MDQSHVLQSESTGVIVKRKRTQTSRRSRPEGQPPTDPSTPVSDDTSKVSSDENNGDANPGKKMFNLNQLVSSSLPMNGSENGSSNPIVINGISDGAGSENKLKKVRFKVSGVTHTIQAKTSSSNGASSSDPSVMVDDPKPRERLIPPQANTIECNSSSLDKKRGLQGIPWKVLSEDMGRSSRRNNNASEKLGDNSDSVHKSKRPPKRRVLDADFDEDDEDDEIRFLEKLKSSKLTGYNTDLNAQPTRRLQKRGKYNNSEDVGGLGRKPISEDMDYEEDEEPSENGDLEGKKKKLTKDLSELSQLTTDNKREITLTTRQRALLTKDATSPSGASQIEFPNGLPPAPSRKQKGKLTDVEQQLKKAEAAQRRKMQNEKAARESEAEAIRKILGQDSSRKKREEKIKKRQEELSQGKATSAQMLVSNTVRTIMGPTGTTVTFPLEMGLPEIFYPKPSGYPPPREKCVAPFCTKDYKYRDSRLRLPLCSLQCYKAINEKLHAGKAC